MKRYCIEGNFDLGSSPKIVPFRSHISSITPISHSTISPKPRLSNQQHHGRLRHPPIRTLLPQRSLHQGPKTPHPHTSQPPLTNLQTLDNLLQTTHDWQHRPSLVLLPPSRRSLRRRTPARNPKGGNQDANQGALLTDPFNLRPLSGRVSAGVAAWLQEAPQDVKVGGEVLCGAGSEGGGEWAVGGALQDWG